MARWEPDALRRLVRAAVELFSEKGYDKTTVVEIAERAGLTKSTFFRHFRDKREVLFAGQEPLSQRLADGIAEAPESATPLEAVAAGLEAAGMMFTAEQREIGPRMQQVVAGNSELQEREALKTARFSQAMTEALRARGVPDPTAHIAAEFGVLAFKYAFNRWLTEPGDPKFPDLARQVLAELQTAAAELH